jgi:spore germination protein GerM
MRASRAFAVGLLVVIAGIGSWWFFTGRRPSAPSSITVYYSKTDGTTLVPWQVTLGPARDRRSVAFYAAVQAVAGPPAGIEAVRFPNGTRVVAVDLNGSAATVDLSDDVGRSVEGSLSEGAEFKALVYTLTVLPGIDAVNVRVAGRRIATLPGGHLELDEPLTRTSF